MSKYSLKHLQSGQGLIEYAILLLLTITLVIGGVELASTALASNKTTDAAKAGINEYVIVNETRLKLQANISRQLERLERVACSTSPCNNSGIVEFLDKMTKNHLGTGYLWRAYQENLSTTPPGVFDLSVTVPSTDALISIEDIDGIEPNVEVEASTELYDIIKLIDGVLDDSGDGVIDSSDRDGDITSEELYFALKYRKSLKIDAIDTATEDGINDENFDILNEVNALSIDPEAKYKVLILLSHIQLSTLALDPRINLSESQPLIGNHDVVLMSKPSCDSSVPADVVYSPGFYGENIDVDGDGFADGIPHQDMNGTDYPAIYLFNPLPIDVATCQGSDAARGDQSQLSILVGGYGNPSDLNESALYVKGLPKLNQAFYSQYTRICINSSDEYVACGGADVDEEVLKAPGKYCLSDVQNDTIDSCPGINPDLINTSGYYFWGKGNEADPDNGEQFQWIYGDSDLPPFRPSFQLLCNGDSHQTETIVGDDCTENFDNYTDDSARSNFYQVEVNVRYRSVFESFLAFGMQELQDDALLPYFYDPSNLRALNAGTVGVPIAGSELGPKQGALPTVKPYKDFRGCYQVNVETNQVSACN